MALVAIGDIDGALPPLRRAVRLRGSLAESYELIAAQLARAGRHREAVLVLEDAVHAAPGSVDLRMKLAEFLSLAGDRETSVKHLQQAVLIAPTNPRLHYRLALELDALGRSDSSRGHYRQALDRFRLLAGNGAVRDPGTWAAMAVSATALDLHDDAVTYFRRTLDLDSTYFDRRPSMRALWERSRRITGDQSGHKP
jgi:Flp pilus assembly protein TadD